MSQFLPFVCLSGHRLEVDNVTDSGHCSYCKQEVRIDTSPEDVRRAMEADTFKSFSFVFFRGKKHKLCEKECLHCHRVYETVYMNSRYCSDECKSIVIKDKEKSRRLGIIVCVMCGKKVQSVDKRRKFCSGACREEMRKY